MVIYISCDNGAAGLISVGVPGTVSVESDLSFDDRPAATEGLTVDLKGKFDTQRTSQPARCKSTSTTGACRARRRYGVDGDPQMTC